MDEKILLTGWKMYVYAVIAVGILLMGMFRLDGIFGRRKPRSKRLPQARGNHPSGRPEFSDPDGRAWKKSRKRK